MGTGKPIERGSTLLLTILLLAVLSVIGVAAVTLSSQERTNAALMTHRDKLVACAQAAQARVWAEMLRYGPGYLKASGATIPTLRLPDGSILAAGHYRDPAVTVVDTTFRAADCKPPNNEEFLDLTNRDVFFSLTGACFRIFARCIDGERNADGQQRELEVEFGLNTVF